MCDSLFFGIVINKHDLLESKGILGLVFIVGIGFNILAIIILILTILFLSKSYTKIYSKLNDMEENNDGTKGAHWNLEQTNTVARQLGIKFDDFNEYDWYASLNMVYSDYYNPKFDNNIYAQLAKDWIIDKDVPKGKTYRYYKKL